MDSKYIRARFTFGLLSLAVGLIASNLALFNWVERTDIQYLFGMYSRYVCAYGGFASIVLGSMLLNESSLENIDTNITPFSTAPYLMMSSDWRTNDCKTQTIGIGDSLKQQELPIERGEPVEEEPKKRLAWRSEKHRIRGKSRRLFRDTGTGRFIRKPEY